MIGDWIYLMPIFGNNDKKKRVYLRRKSLRLQSYSIVGLMCLAGALALNEIIKDSTERGGTEMNNVGTNVKEAISYWWFSNKYSPQVEGSQSVISNDTS